VHGLTSSAEASRTPEEWYAQIEALRAAGRIEQAKAELEKLEAAYPGWLEKHLRQER
jgi:outer membrane protein assembly factor BamD (BamD/ComL family)